MTTRNPQSKPVRPRRGVAALLLAAKLVVSAGLLILLFTWIDPRALLRRFSNIDWGWLLIGLVILKTQDLLATLKWKITLKADGLEAPFLFLWKTYLIGGFLSLFLPTSFGGDLYRVSAVSKSGAHGLSKSAAAVLFDRITGGVALATLGMTGALFLLGTRDVIVLVSLYVLAVVASVILTSDAVVTRLPQPQSKYLGFPFRILRSFNRYRRSPWKLACTLALSGVFQFNVVVIAACYARALHVSPQDVSFTEMLATVPVAYLSNMLPISINGIGVQDAAFVFAFKKIGGTADQGLALSLLILAIRYISGIVGGVLLLRGIWRGRRAALSTTPANEPVAAVVRPQAPVPRDEPAR